jgi:hypothetical protein
MFSHDSSLHYVSLPIDYVRSKGERQTLIQIVAFLSQSHGLPQETALAIPIYTHVVQYSYDRKTQSLNMLDLLDRIVTKHGEWNFHRKTLMSFLKNELNPRDPSKMTVSHAK